MASRCFLGFLFHWSKLAILAVLINSTFRHVLFASSRADTTKVGAFDQTIDLLAFVHMINHQPIEQISRSPTTSRKFLNSGISQRKRLQLLALLGINHQAVLIPQVFMKCKYLG